MDSVSQSSSSSSCSSLCLILILFLFPAFIPNDYLQQYVLNLKGHKGGKTSSSSDLSFSDSSD
jgi:hypothetical protein